MSDQASEKDPSAQGDEAEASSGRSPEPEADDAERREGPRAPIELRVEYKRLNSFFADYTRNISRGGTFIQTDKPLPIGTEFVFKLHVPKLTAPLTLRGKVQWIVPSGQANAECKAGMGIGFVYGSEAERERVQTVVEKLMINSLGQSLFDKLLGRPDRA